MAEQQYMSFISRRSPVLGMGGCVASSQPAASKIGADILEAGGNAADAAVAMAAALNVTMPCSTGIGGDCFCLFYDADSRRVQGLNASGRSASSVSLDTYHDLGFNDNNRPPNHHGLNVTVPGAAAGWVDTVEMFGSKKLSLRQILQPAINLAERGFAVHPVAANTWECGASVLHHEGNPHGHHMLLQGKPPKAGDVMRMPHLANTFKQLATKGKAGFYEGPIAQAIVDIVQTNGGVLSISDLKSHVTTFDDPISTTYRGVRVWEMPPSGQGMAALMALNILEEFDLQEMGFGTPAYLHHLIEALKLSIADCLEFCADPSVEKVPVNQLISKIYAATRRPKITPDRAQKSLRHGDPSQGGDTVYFCVTDKDGNACSFINSNYKNFGSGLIPKDCGFTLQNRGSNFRLVNGHMNCVSGGKRPFHTIIPAMVTGRDDYDDDDDLLAAFGVMGGFMQPQGHVQVLLNMVEFGMNPQLALDQPRFCIDMQQQGLKDSVFMEEGFSSSTSQELASMGHRINGPITGFERRVFGRGQVISKGDWWSKEVKHGERSGVFWAGSDPRGDGMAVGI